MKEFIMYIEGEVFFDPNEVNNVLGNRETTLQVDYYFDDPNSYRWRTNTDYGVQLGQILKG